MSVYAPVSTYSRLSPLVLSNLLFIEGEIAPVLVVSVYSDSELSLFFISILVFLFVFISAFRSLDVQSSVWLMVCVFPGVTLNDSEYDSTLLVGSVYARLYVLVVPDFS